MTALDHNGVEHKISLKDGQVSVTRDGQTLTAPAGKDPTTVARKLAGQLAGGTVQTAYTSGGPRYRDRPGPQPGPAHASRRTAPAGEGAR